MGFLKKLFGGGPNEMQKMQTQLDAVYVQVIEGLSLALFARCIKLLESKYAITSDAVAVQVKLCCTGEGQNATSLERSTQQERDDGARIAAEIMAEEVAGIYSEGDLNKLVEEIAEFPEDVASIKRMALCFDQIVACMILGRAADLSNPAQPVIDITMLRETALPLIEWALKHDPSSSHLNATAAQLHYSMNDLDTGFAAAKRAVDANANNAEAWRLLGNGYMMRNENAEARHAFATA